jgi:cytochrome oxidase Cu insertion factor (SCO1/SenC/PrrC family)
MNSATDNSVKPRSFASLWVLIAMFALPMIAAWVFFLNPQWLPAGRTNNGELIDPPRSVQSLQLRTPEGEHFDWQSLQDLWAMTLVSEGGCDAACIEVLIKLRQIRRATAEKRQRIARLLILMPDKAGRLDLPNLDGLEGTQLLLADNTQRARIESIFPLQLSEQAIPIFLIDPKSDLMMKHDTTKVNSKEILRDLEKLLKASENWAKGGRYGH